LKRRFRFIGEDWFASHFKKAVEEKFQQVLEKTMKREAEITSKATILATHTPYPYHITRQVLATVWDHYADPFKAAEEVLSIAARTNKDPLELARDITPTPVEEGAHISDPAWITVEVQILAAQTGAPYSVARAFFMATGNSDVCRELIAAWKKGGSVDQVLVVWRSNQPPVDYAKVAAMLAEAIKPTTKES
jgi:hypothetical protein